MTGLFGIGRRKAGFGLGFPQVATVTPPPPPPVGYIFSRLIPVLFEDF